MIDNSGWKSSDHIIILYYHSYSCGKFLSNILSFNDNFVAQIALTEKVKRYNRDIEILGSKKIFDQTIENQLREYKIANIFQTIPPDQDSCLDWWEYELGCQMFWNFNSIDIDGPGIIDTVHRNCLCLLENQKYCFIVAHDLIQLERLKRNFYNAKIIELINDIKIRQASIELKLGKKQGLLSNNPHTSNPTQQNSIKFDIGSMFDRELFFENIQNLLSKFDINDKTLDQRVFDFYEKYVSLYKGYIK